MKSQFMFFDLVQPRQVENSKPEKVESKPKKQTKAKPVPVLLGKLTRKWSDWSKSYNGTWKPGQEPPSIEPL